MTTTDFEPSHFPMHPGFVYIAINPAWPDYVKIGCAADCAAREDGFQTGSPFRDYKIIESKHFGDRYLAERAVHNKLRDHRASGEWFRVDTAYAVATLRSTELKTGVAVPAPQYPLSRPAALPRYPGDILSDAPNPGNLPVQRDRARPPPKYRPPNDTPTFAPLLQSVAASDRHPRPAPPPDRRSPRPV